MRISTSLSAGIGALALIAGSLFAAQPAAAAGIDIPDPNLKTCVNRTLGQADQAEISQEQATNVTVLKCNYTVQSLSGLRNFMNLTEFETSGDKNKLTDLSPLSTLTSLTKLVIVSSAVNDLSPLKGLNQLAELTVRVGKVSDVTPLSSLENLKKIDVVRNQIMDLRPFKPLVDRGVVIDADFQYLRLAPINVLETFANPARNLNGEFAEIFVSSDQGTAVIAENFSSWRWTKAAKNNVVTWSTENSGINPAFLQASGFLVQDALPVATTLKEDFVSTNYQTPVTIDVLANDGLPEESPVESASLAVLQGGATVSTMTLTEGFVEVVDAKIKFTPAAGFSGTVQPIGYQIRNADNVISQGKLTVTVGAAPAVVTPPVDPVTPEPVQPVGNEISIATTSNTKTAGPETELANTGTSTSTPLALAGLLLLAGIAATLFARRRAS